MGPQLALQLLPLPPRSQALPPLLPQQHQQQQWDGENQREQQQQQEQRAEGRLVAPSAALLTELLPLLTHHCLAHLQQLEQQQREVASVQTKLSPLEQLLSTLLVCSVVQAAGTAAAEGLPPALPLATAAAAAPAAAPVLTAAAPAAPAREGHSNRETANSCVVHALGAFVPHAGDIIRVLEGGIRLVACYAAAVTAAATATAAGAAGAYYMHKSQAS
jgi:hypothetical protein